VKSVAWIAATVIGFVAGGIALHSPGAVSLGQYAFEWDLPAAVAGAVFGAVVGAFTGFAIAVAHALADGAPATWGVSLAAAMSGFAAALAFAWAAHSWDWRTVALMSFAWWAGWVGGVAVLGAIAPVVGYGVVDHPVIGTVLGLSWGAATSPAMRRIFGERRALSSEPQRV
jgi:hypothetical protein